MPALLKALKTRRFTKFNNLLQQIFILSTAEHQFFCNPYFFVLHNHHDKNERHAHFRNSAHFI